MTDITASTPVRRALAVGRRPGAAQGQQGGDVQPVLSGADRYRLRLRSVFCAASLYDDLSRLCAHAAQPLGLSEPEMIETALQDAVRRMRADLEEWHEQDDRVFVTISSAKAIDDRVTRYLDRYGRTWNALLLEGPLCQSVHRALPRLVRRPAFPRRGLWLIRVSHRTDIPTTRARPTSRCRTTTTTSSSPSRTARPTWTAHRPRSLLDQLELGSAI